ncbi:hypothetical protein BJV78DRAFT_1138445, partial [Lactifluus subvellereus]
LVNEVTTLHRHLEANHSGKYRIWAKSVNFLSKLPGDVKKRKEAKEEVHRTLDCDLWEKVSERVVPYSDKLFRRTAVEWIAATDQPLQALEHPKFKELIDVASCVTSGVKIPGQKAAQGEVISLFKGHITRLRAKLNVSVPFGCCLSLSFLSFCICRVQLPKAKSA